MSLKMSSRCVSESHHQPTLARLRMNARSRGRHIQSPKHGLSGQVIYPPHTVFPLNLGEPDGLLATSAFEGLLTSTPPRLWDGVNIRLAHRFAQVVVNAVKDVPTGHPTSTFDPDLPLR